MVVTPDYARRKLIAQFAQNTCKERICPKCKQIDLPFHVWCVNARIEETDYEGNVPSAFIIFSKEFNDLHSCNAHIMATVPSLGHYH